MFASSARWLHCRWLWCRSPRLRRIIRRGRSPSSCRSLSPARATDFLARLLGKELEERLGNPVVVEKPSGAGTTIVSNSVAKAAPDGHTLLMATRRHGNQRDALQKSAVHDPTSDFVPVAMVAQSPCCADRQAVAAGEDRAEFIAYAKERPGQLSFGSGGPGSPHHLFAEAVREHDRHENDSRSPSRAVCRR